MTTREPGSTTGAGGFGQRKLQSFQMSPPPFEDSPTNEKNEKGTFSPSSSP